MHSTALLPCHASAHLLHLLIPCTGQYVCALDMHLQRMQEQALEFGTTAPVSNLGNQAIQVRS
jgi:hypothetical protein